MSCIVDRSHSPTPRVLGKVKTYLSLGPHTHASGCHLTPTLYESQCVAEISFVSQVFGYHDHAPDRGTVSWFPTGDCIAVWFPPASGVSHL